MAPAPQPVLTPRKAPRQARASATIDAIFEAAVQLLAIHEPVGLTTTQIAKRAGVSVGTLYQYFPNKQSMLYALTERYFDIVATSLENACHAQRGMLLGHMTEALVQGYWEATSARCAMSRAVCRIAVEVNTMPLSERFSERMEATIAEMLVSAPDARFADVAMISMSLLASIIGTTRAIFDRNLPKPWGCGIRQQLALMCHSYLAAANAASVASTSSLGVKKSLLFVSS